MRFESKIIKIKPWISRILLDPKIARWLIFFKPHRFIISLYSFCVDFSVLPEGSALSVLSGYGKNLKMILSIGEKTNSQLLYYWMGFHELDVQRLFSRFVRPGFVIYDIGAYFGFYSLLSGRLTGPIGKVYAFEPLSGNVKQIKLNISLNAMNNVVFSIPKVVSDITGNAVFCDFGRNDWGRVVDTGVSSGGLSIGRATIMDSISLDDFVFQDGHPGPDLIKVDVEGLEGKVLAGARQVIKKFKPIIICEIHGPESSKRVYQELFNLGYRFEDTNRKRLISIPSDHCHIAAYPILD